MRAKVFIFQIFTNTF